MTEKFQAAVAWQSDGKHSVSVEAIDESALPSEMSAGRWHRLRGHPADETVLSLDGDSLIMHVAAALGARQCR